MLKHENYDAKHRFTPAKTIEEARVVLKARRAFKLPSIAFTGTVSRNVDYAPRHEFETMHLGRIEPLSGAREDFATITRHTEHGRTFVTIEP